MREVISIHVGNCGNQIANSYWKQICAEHRVSADGVYGGDKDIYLAGIKSQFQEVKGNGQDRYVPRSLHFDSDPTSLDNLQASDIGRLFHPDSFIKSDAPTGNNWAKGHYTLGSQLVDTCMDAIRKKAEAADLLEAFVISHSLGGGTGSGFATLLGDKIRGEYPNIMTQSFAVFPSPTISNSATEAYNTILSMGSLLNHFDMVHMIDNEALVKYVCASSTSSSAITYSSLNRPIACAISDSTAAVRFPGRRNTSLRKIGVNIIPFPRMHFFIPNIYSANTPLKLGSDIVSPLFQIQNSLCSVNIREGKMIAGAAIFRGQYSTYDLENTLVSYSNKNPGWFVDWAPNNIDLSMCDVAAPDRPVSSMMINNNSSCTTVFNKIKDQFNAQYSSKAHAHWYTNEGMDPYEFTEAANHLSEITSEYENYARATSNEYEVGDEN